MQATDDLVINVTTGLCDLHKPHELQVWGMQHVNR